MRRWKQPVSLGCDVYDRTTVVITRAWITMLPRLTIEPTRNWRNIALQAAVRRCTFEFYIKLLVFWRSSCKVNIAEVSWRTCGGKPMISANQFPPAEIPPEAGDQVDDAALAEVMRVVPLGAGVVAGTAVALLVIGYLAIYLLIFLPRGPVG